MSVTFNPSQIRCLLVFQSVGCKQLRLFAVGLIKDCILLLKSSKVLTLIVRSVNL